MTDRILRKLAGAFVLTAIGLVVAGVALALRRVRGGGALVALVGLGGAVLFVHAWAIGWLEAFAYPVLPAVVFAAICAAVGERRT